MTKTLTKIFGVVVSLCLLTCLPAAAQATANSQIAGVVRDASGAAIPGAQVTAVQVQTGASRTVVSQADGSYTLPNLPVGPYRLEVKAKGFSSYVQNGIVLQVNENPTINPTMKVGEVSQQVEVTANAAMAETHDTSVAQVIDQRRIVQLPLNGRQATQLILLSGGSTNAPSGDLNSSKNYQSGSVTISVAGGQANGTNYTMDGGDNNDSFSNVNLPFPFPDALQEFSVQTSGLSAQYGVHPGAVVNVVTKSGANQIHGDLFEFVRNGALNARNAFASTQDSLKRNQFGGTIGGPIVKNKVFFFAGYQGTRIRTTPPTTKSYVPNAAVLAGDFSTIDAPPCVSGKTARTLIDPATGKPFPNNQVDPSRFNQQALNIVKLLPTSTDPCGLVEYGIPSPNDEDQVIGRVDWTKSENHSLFFRYFISDDNQPPVFDGKNLLTTTKYGDLARNQSAVFGDTYTLSPDTINSFHLTGNRLRIDRGPADNLINPGQLGVNVPILVRNFITMGVSSHFNVGCGTCSPGHFNTNSVQLADDLQLIRGSHQISIGADWIHNQLNELSNFKSNGSFGFNGTATGDPLLDFLLGMPNDFTQGNPEEENWRQNYVGFYGQDNYRVNARLSINFGMRWEPYFPEYDRYGRGNHFDLAAFEAGQKSQVYVNAPAGLFFRGDKNTPYALTNSHLANFAPRIGFIFDPAGNGRETIRASYGIYNDSPEIFYFDRFADSAPFGSSIDISSPAGGLTNPYQGYPGGAPFPQPFPPASNAFFPSYGVYVNLPQNIKPTYTQAWNLSFQRQIGANWLASINYIGNKTTHLWLGTEANPAQYIPGNCTDPVSGKTSACSTTGNTNQRRMLYLMNPVQGAGYSTIAQTDDGANANYNALLVSLNHRFASHFTTMSNYTWSHCISEGDFSGEIAGPAYQNPYNRNGDRGNCGFDHRHIFNTSLVFASPTFANAWTQRFIGNWELSGIITVHSGEFLTITSGKDYSLTGVGNDRPNLVGNPAVSDPTIAEWFNPAAFAKNAAGTFGNVGRATVLGPGAFNFDMGLSRKFQVREGQNLEFRLESFNALNHVNFSNPHTSMSDSNFGKITGAGDPRILQLALKYVF